MTLEKPFLERLQELVAAGKAKSVSAIIRDALECFDFSELKIKPTKQVVMSVRLPGHVRQELNHFSKKKHASAGQLVRVAVESYLPDLEAPASAEATETATEPELPSAATATEDAIAPAAVALKKSTAKPKAKRAGSKSQAPEPPIVAQAPSPAARKEAQPKSSDAKQKSREPAKATVAARTAKKTKPRETHSGAKPKLKVGAEPPAKKPKTRKR